MSSFKVELCLVTSVEAHPNADKLEIVKLKNKDWQCVSAKGNIFLGDLVIYFPIDSLLPQELEAKIFGPNSKVKLTGSRIKTIKLRGAISQGLILKPDNLFMDYSRVPSELLLEGGDWTEFLEVKKYETVEKGSPLTKGKSSVQNSNPNFRKYTGIENAKNYNNIFQEGEEVMVTCKIHGSNVRMGYVPYYASTWWQKVFSYLKLTPKYQFVYGSHNRQLQDKLLYKGYYQTNVYAEVVKNYKLKEILKPGEVVFGEVYGGSIQKGYSYDCKLGERKFIGFEVMVDDKYLSPLEAKKWFEVRQLPFVPVLYTGPFNKEKIMALRDGPSVLAPSQKVREGVVVRALKEEHCYIGRKILKFISDEYLLKNQDTEEGPAH